MYVISQAGRPPYPQNHGCSFRKSVAAGAEGFGVRWLAIALDFFASALSKNQPHRQNTSRTYPP
jgi:hypothetical protein